MVRACFYSSLSLCFREVGRNFSLSASLKRRRFRSRGRRRWSSPLALAGALTMRSTPLLNCCSFLHRVIQSSVSRYSFSLTSPDCRRFTRPFATKRRYSTLQNAYMRASSVPFDLPRTLLELLRRYHAHFLHVSFRTFPHV